jgi:hypothetical protein
MEDKKAKFIVYIVIALIALVASSAVYSMTGGLSDWVVASIDDNQDKNNNGYLDSSEDNGFFSFLDSDNNKENYKSSSDDGNGFGELIDKAYNKVFNSDSSSSSSYYSSSSSDDNPDFLAKILRMFINDG